MSVAEVRPNRARPLLTLLPYLRRYRKRLLLGTLMVLVTNGAAVLVPWVLKEAIDTLQTGQMQRSDVFFYAALLLGFTAVEGVFRYLMRRILIGLSRIIEYDLRNDLFSHLQSLSAPFYQANATGDLMARCTNDLAAVRAVLGPGIMYSINTVFTSLLAISILLTISPRLTVLTLIPLIAVSISVKYFGRLIHARFEEIQRQFSWITTLVQENVSGIRVVQAYNQEEAFIERFREANSLYLRKNLSLARIQGTFQPLLGFLLGLSSVGLLWYGGTLVVAGTITLGDFVAFLAYLAMLTWPTIALGFVINLFERGSASMGRLRQILDATPDVDDTTATPVSDIRGSLEVRNLTFSYDQTPVLEDVSFQVDAGTTLAIVGRTGSGKSTLADLICRLHPVDEGTLFVDGIDVNQIPVAQLRSAIGYAPQDAFLFSESVGQNIAFGDPAGGVARIEQAATISNVLDDIREFPKQFDTFVGERGITLSGGQKQRVSISRALLPEPRILILDDSLSAVDTHTEEEILGQLASQLADRTAILISHRISTVKMADRIIVLDQGRIVEEGTHDQLLQRSGYYAELYQRQLLKEELDLE